jgi:hypothetical protein
MTWTETLGTDVTAAFLGIQNDFSDLAQEVARRGWTLGKVKYNNGAFEAEASSPHGEKQLGRGKDENSALAHLVMRIMRQEFMRTPRTAGWGTNWTDHLQEIAQAYQEAPIYDPNAAPAWRELAQDSLRRAKLLQTQIHIEVVDEPEPYPSVQDMSDDVRKNAHLFVSRAHADHPVWSVDESVAFRIVHDVLGHVAAGSDFGWQGENQACAAHLPLLSPLAQKALFTECIGATAYGAYFRTYSPQKISFLDDYIEPAQEEENGAGHSGVHPSQSVVPVEVPHVEPKLGATETTDPNLGWRSGLEPLPDNGFMWHGDPLQAHTEGGLMDTAGNLDTGWSGLTHGDGSPDHESMKQAVVNALRASLLGKRKDPKWNAAHYQDLMELGAHVDDPKRFHDFLEAKREEHNQARGLPPGAHQTYYEAQRAFENWIHASHPHLGFAEAQELSEREFMALWIDEEERLHLDPKNERLSANELEEKVGKEIERRLMVMLKPEMKDADVHRDQMRALSSSQHDPYGSWLRSSLKDIARIGVHAQDLTNAALMDVREHGGAGHHFRAKALSLGIDPKEASYAWMLLQPKTSQLGVIDRPVMTALGHDFDRDSCARDYFKHERELAAGRDGAGYGTHPAGLVLLGYARPRPRWPGCPR